MPRDKRFTRALATAAGILLLADAVFAFGWPAWGWGIHHLRFFPLWLRIGLPVAGLGLVLLPASEIASRWLSRIPIPADRPSLKYAVYLLGAAFALLPFWAFQVRVHLLGDGSLWIRELTGTLGRLEAEPLAIRAVRLLYSTIGGGGEADAERAYRILSWGSGVLFVFLALLTAEILGRNRRERCLAAFLLLTLGTCQIFFGYAEHYGPAVAGLLLYLCLGLFYLAGRVPLAVPAAALGLASAFHFVVLGAVPSLGYLVYRARRSRAGGGRPLLGASVFPLVFFGLLYAAGYDLQWELSRLSAKSGWVPFWGGEPFMRPHALLSAVHVTDVVNALMLAVPAGLLLCLCLVGTARQQIEWGDSPLIFLGWAAGTYLTFVVGFSPEIGAFRDWDLLSVSGVPLALLAAYLVTRGTGPEAQRRATWISAVLALCQLVSWIGVNANGDRSVDRFETILEAGPRLSIHALGSSYDELRAFREGHGSPLRALDAARSALEVHPRHPRYLANVVRLLGKSGQTGEVEATLQRSIASEPDFAPAYFHLGRFYREGGRLAEAESSCRRALAIDPEVAEAHAEMGAILEAQGRNAEAAETMERAVALEPENAWAQNLLGFTLGKIGRLEEAIVAFRRATSRGPDYVDAWANLGFAYYQTGRLEESERAYRHALDLDPENAVAKNGLGILYQEQGKSDAPLRMFRDAVAAEPRNVPALLNLASAAYMAGELEESLSACERALEVDPTNGKALYNLCALYTELERMDEAVRHVKRYIELFPDSPEAKNLKALMESVP